MFGRKCRVRQNAPGYLSISLIHPSHFVPGCPSPDDETECGEQRQYQFRPSLLVSLSCPPTGHLRPRTAEHSPAQHSTAGIAGECGAKVGVGIHRRGECIRSSAGVSKAASGCGCGCGRGRGRGRGISQLALSDWM